MHASYKVSVDVVSEKPVVVRQGAQLSPLEAKALSRRLPRVKKHIENLLKKKLSYNNVPNIALLMSGGGYRAMIASLGFLRGIKSIDVLNAACYAATLSGSSWMYAGWLRHKISLECYTEMLKRKVSKNLFLTPIDFSEVGEILMRKIYNRKKITLVDLWGILIGNMLFSEISPAGKNVFLSDLAPLVKKGKYPLPILTSISPYRDVYTWFEHTPWEVGSADYGYFVPIQAFNSRFYAGIVINRYHEETCGFHLGICGSAFAASAQDLFKIYKNEIADEVLLEALKDVINDLNLDDVRFSTAKIHNFMRRLDPQQVPQERMIDLIDAGIDIGLPFAPIMRRYVDILIICDASSDAPYGLALQQVAAYAKKYNVPFPTIPEGPIDVKSVSVFDDEANPKTSIVVYIPNENNFSLFKFEYSAAEFSQLYGAMKQKVEDNHLIFWRVISKKVAQLERLYSGPNSTTR